eukprot:3727119-Rhodomonas_salina.1
MRMCIRKPVLPHHHARQCAAGGCPSCPSCSGMRVRASVRISNAARVSARQHSDAHVISIRV